MGLLPHLQYFPVTVNQRAITTELSDLHSTVQDIRAACQKIQSTPDDHFISVMSVR